MKFTTAWAQTASQNVTLKVATVALTTISIVQLFAILSLTFKELPVIEKGCFSRAIYPISNSQSKNEIESFLSESLPMRFDTLTYLKDGFLSLEELAAREKEFASFRQREISQKLSITEIKGEGKDIIVYADRILSVGKIKSVLPITLKIEIQKTNRTESNPYGLVLSSVNQVEQKEEK